MKKKITITKLVRRVTIINPEASFQHPAGWEVSVRTDFNEGSETDMEIYTASHYESPDQIERIEPGMYVKIVCYEYQLKLSETQKGELMKHTVIRAEEIYIDQEKTKEERTHFDFVTFKDAEMDGIVHKVVDYFT